MTAPENITLSWDQLVVTVEVTGDGERQVGKIVCATRGKSATATAAQFAEQAGADVVTEVCNASIDQVRRRRQQGEE